MPIRIFFYAEPEPDPDPDPNWQIQSRIAKRISSNFKLLRVIHNELNKLKNGFDKIIEFFYVNLVGSVTDPDQQALDAAALDTDPTKNGSTTLKL
jgi:hypothetical protein